MGGPKKNVNYPKANTSNLCNCAKKTKKPKGILKMSQWSGVVLHQGNILRNPLGFLWFLAQLHRLEVLALGFFGFFWDLPCETHVFD